MPNTKKTVTPKPSAIIVQCLANTGYRRAGMAFKRGDNIVPHNELNDTQLAQLKADPRLVVSNIKATSPKAASKADKADSTPPTLDTNLLSNPVSESNATSKSNSTNKAG